MDSLSRPTREMKPIRIEHSTQANAAADARCSTHIRYSGLTPPDNGCTGCWKYWKTV